MGGLPLTGEGFGYDDEPVVLGGDFDPPGPVVPDRLVDPVVAEFQFLRAPSHSLPQDLVSQTDPEDRNPAQEKPGRGDNVGEGRRVSGTVGQKDAVRAAGQDLLPCRRGGENGYGTSRSSSIRRMLYLTPQSRTATWRCPVATWAGPSSTAGPPSSQRYGVGLVTSRTRSRPTRPG